MRSDRDVGPTSKIPLLVSIALLVVLASGYAAFHVSRPTTRARRALSVLQEQRGHGYLYTFSGPETRFVPNEAFARLLEQGDDAVGPVVEAIGDGRLDKGQIAILDLALWVLTTGRPKTAITVLGSYQRPIGRTDMQAVVRAWQRWDAQGRPMPSASGQRRPELEGYPEVEDVLRK